MASTEDSTLMNAITRIRDVGRFKANTLIAAQKRSPTGSLQSAPNGGFGDTADTVRDSIKHWNECNTYTALLEHESRIGIRENFDSQSSWRNTMAGVTAEGRIKASTLSTVQRRDPTEGSRPASNDGSGSHSYITTAVGGFTDSIMKAMTKAKPNNALMMEKDPMRRQGNEMAPIEQDTTNGIKENFSPQRLWQNGTIKIMDVGRFSAKAIAVLPRSPGGSSLSRSNDTSSSQSHTSTNNKDLVNRQRDYGSPTASESIGHDAPISNPENDSQRSWRNTITELMVADRFRTSLSASNGNSSHHIDTASAGDPLNRQKDHEFSTVSIERATPIGVRQNFEPQRLWRNAVTKIMAGGRFNANELEAVHRESSVKSSTSASSGDSSNHGHIDSPAQTLDPHTSTMLEPKSSDSAVQPASMQQADTASVLIEELRQEHIVQDLSGQFPQREHNPVARGGYSEVFRSYWRRPNGADLIPVCYKVLRPPISGLATAIEHTRKVVKHLRREMKVWKDLKHPNIVEFIGYAIEHEVGGVTAALVSQWCANGNVVKYLEQNPAADREMLVSDVARGLLYLHNHDAIIVHADLKPLNILINDTGRAQLCDFGLSRILDGLPTGQTTSDQGGTLRFLAPELLESSEEDSHPTTKSDVYAFGCTCVQILFDHPPYHWLKRDVEVLKAIEHQVAPWAWSDKPLEQLLASCCSASATRPLMSQIVASGLLGPS